MTINDLLHWVGALSLLLYGLASATKPHWVAGILENDLDSGRGISEFRVAHGGGMIALSLFAFYANDQMVFQLLGWGWMTAAIVRIVSYLPDRPRITTDYLVFLAAEILLGIFLLI